MTVKLCSLSRMMFVLLAVLMTGGTAQAAPYVSPSGFTLTPPDWTRLNSNGAEAIFTAPPIHRFAANINFVSSPAPRSSYVSVKTLFAELMAQTKSSYSQKFPHYKNLSESKTSVAGAPAVQLISTIQVGKPMRMVQIHQVYALNNGQFHIFTLTSLPVNFAQNDAAFAAMLRTVKWTK
jgi:hypothetical protein